MSPEIIETFAMRAALGNNGGAWAEHYTDEQKEHWRRFVRDLVAGAVHAEHVRCMDVTVNLIEAEREACAKIADEHPCENEFQCCGWRVAEVIRARGNP
jgi:hypothetical protein